MSCILQILSSMNEYGEKTNCTPAIVSGKRSWSSAIRLTRLRHTQQRTQIINHRFDATRVQPTMRCWQTGSHGRKRVGRHDAPACAIWSGLALFLVPNIGQVWHAVCPRTPLQARAKGSAPLWALELLAVLCCCIVRVCDGVRIRMTQEITFQLQHISHLRHGSGADSLVLLVPPVTARRYVRSLRAYR